MGGSSNSQSRLARLAENLHSLLPPNNQVLRLQALILSFLFLLVKSFSLKLRFQVGESFYKKVDKLISLSNLFINTVLQDSYCFFGDPSVFRVFANLNY